MIALLARLTWPVQLALFVAVLGSLGFGGWKVYDWIVPDKLTLAECRAKADDANLKALLAAKDKALTESAAALAELARDFEETTAEITRQELEKHELRQSLRDPDVAVFTADDPWMRGR